MERQAEVKPPYRIPPLAEIRRQPRNGFQVVSTFSGGGGSSLGYWMAGYTVVWASEFVEAARETYRANFPSTPIDERDIRQVRPEDILEATGLKPGELDLLDGSPPCAAFSTAGKREKGWGQVRAYSGTKQVVDDLFFEYARLLRGLRPRVFLAENVAGLVVGTARGYFKQIMCELEACGYRVRATLVNGAFAGVPQRRQRLFIYGVREDLGLEPPAITPLPYAYTFGDALPEGRLEGPHWIMPEHSQTRLLWQETRRLGIGSLAEAAKRVFGRETMMQHYRCLYDQPINTVVQASQSLYHPDEPRSLSIPELKRLGGFPEDYVLTGSFPQQWERIGRAVPPLMMAHVARHLEEVLRA